MKVKINRYTHVSVHMYIYAHTYLLACMKVCKHSFFPIQEAKAFPVIESKLSSPSDKVPRHSTAWRHFGLGENADAVSLNWNGQHKYPSLSRGCFWVRTPSLHQGVRHRWPFSQHSTLLLWLTFKVRTSGYKLMRDSDKANSAAFGCTKMQFFISNRPRKSQRPHTSHSLPMRLMQQVHRDQAKLSESLFPVKVLLLMRTQHVRVASRGQG